MKMDKFKSNGNNLWSVFGHREIHDKSSELMGKTNLHPKELVSQLFFHCFSPLVSFITKLVSKIHSPGWVDFWQEGHPLLHLHEVLAWEVFTILASLQISGGRFQRKALKQVSFQVTDSTVMRSKQIFFTLSPDGLTQFSLDHTVFIDLKRWLL